MTLQCEFSQVRIFAPASRPENASPAKLGNVGFSPVELAIILLGKSELLDEVLSAIAEVGVHDAGVAEAEGLEKILAEDIPIFAGLRQILEGEKAKRHVIIAPLLPGANIDELDKLLLDRGIDFRAPETGVMMSISIDKIITPSTKQFPGVQKP